MFTRSEAPCRLVVQGHDFRGLDLFLWSKSLRDLRPDNHLAVLNANASHLLLLLLPDSLDDVKVHESGL